MDEVEEEQMEAAFVDLLSSETAVVDVADSLRFEAALSEEKRLLILAMSCLREARSVLLLGSGIWIWRFCGMIVLMKENLWEVIVMVVIARYEYSSVVVMKRMRQSGRHGGT